MNPFSLKGRILSIISTLLTISLALPSLKALAKNPSNKRFIRAIQLNALVFTQVGYCVHEKIFLWFVIPLTFSIFDDSHHLYFSSTMNSLAGAIFIVIESKNLSLFYQLCAMHLLLFLFYSQLPRTRYSEESVGWIRSMSQSVTKKLSLSIVVALILGFRWQGIHIEEYNSWHYAEKMCLYLAVTYVPIWCYLHIRAVGRQESDYRLKYKWALFLDSKPIY